VTAGLFAASQSNDFSGIGIPILDLSYRIKIHRAIQVLKWAGMHNEKINHAVRAGKHNRCAFCG
jgi:hypothetical protein